jgi:hypothetical protein
VPDPPQFRVRLEKRWAIAVGMRSMIPAFRPYSALIVPKVRPVDIKSVVNAACGAV